ncbi:class E sortase [Streptomyces sp.]|uniref:class E sortase n=1 Tax=Streptomyces sp. TaxID=1931 RepID=UPI002F40D9F6
MTTLRPERSADGPVSYEDTGQFAAVVGRLDDPLNDPLPGRQPMPPAHGEPVFGGRPDDPESGYPQPVFAEPPAYPDPVLTEPPVFTQPPVLTGPAFAGPARTQPAPAHGEPPYAQPATAPPLFTELDPVPTGPEPDPGLSRADPRPASAPPDGGRAARRKAAARQGPGGHAGGGHRARGRGGTAPIAPAEPSAPLSRVEARRAARAAKDSTGVLISRIVGELFITTGLLMLLFVTYQLWWTNVRAHQQASGAANNLRDQWDSTEDDPNRVPGTFSPGEGFAIMYIPKLDVKAPVAEGISKQKVLDKGMIGHYDGALSTAMPWDKAGNFGVAAHRNTHGEPFRYVNHLVPGDKVVVETANTYYTYAVTSALASTPPSNISVLRPVPVGSGFTRPGRYLTLTTCTPEFTSTNRLIVWGKLVEERPRTQGKPDALLGG